MGNKTNATYSLTGRKITALPVGAGPFRLIEFAFPDASHAGASSNARCVLERNEHYWGDKARLNAIIVHLVPDLRSGAEAMRTRQNIRLTSGEIDLQEGALRIDIEQANSEDAKRFEAMTVSIAPVTMFIALNSALPPLDDIRFRRALAKSIDSHAIPSFTRHL